MQKIFGVVILYFPDNAVIDNIKSYLNYVEKLIIIDNSVPSCTLNFNLSDSIILIKNNDNLGIAQPLNQALQFCKTNQADWLLTMDQDSKFTDVEIEHYLSCMAKFNNLDQVGMFGINYEENTQTKNCESIETDNLITSGSLVNVKIAHKIGGFDEQLFIDEVDSEYCYRINKNGFKTIKFNHIHLHHALGTAGLYRSLKSGKLTQRALHSHTRIYYMVRNYLYVYHQYKNIFPASFPHRKKAIFNRIKNKFLYGKDSWKLIKLIIQAYIDYKKGNMGKLNNS